MAQNLRKIPVVEVPHASQCGVGGSRLRQQRAALEWNFIIGLANKLHSYKSLYSNKSGCTAMPGRQSER
ncbi:hypothetical protein [Anderseniella sp. Alg231-50]|uniref:hypothetical protein n=1 Tax=Anderseniella sp. Alg231-50 TaxID=1922226 RepID=UPI00307C4665